MLHVNTIPLTIPHMTILGPTFREFIMIQYHARHREGVALGAIYFCETCKKKLWNILGFQGASD